MRIASGFNNKSGSSADDGFNKVLNVARPFDVLIFSDLNHETSATKFADLFSIERLEELSKRGYKNIFLEELESQQNIADQLANGEILKETFIAEMMEGSVIQHISKEADYIQRSNLADVVTAASKLGIKVHFAQIENTKEQRAVLAFHDENRQDLIRKGLEIDLLPKPNPLPGGVFSSL